MANSKVTSSKQLNKRGLNKKIAVIGSAFNPPTLGHKDVIEQVLASSIGFDTVALVPNYRHAFGKEMADYAKRCELLSLFVQDINNARVSALCIEQNVQKVEGQPVYTYDVLSHIASLEPSGTELYFVIGPDNFANWDKFYKAEEIKTKWNLLCVEELVDVRSTSVRNAIECNLPLDHMVTPSVSSFLTQSALYESK